MKKSFIINQETRNPIRELYSWLKSLQSTLCFMQTGAHPDDETTRLLAALSLGQGAHIVYVNAVRGQGGQNALGPERGDALGYLRTEELIAAMALIRADLAWLAETDDDPIRDFGFSKSDEQTFGYWGEAHSLRQMIKIVRMFKPDILLPTFLDVPGQHGHHRAVTQVTLSAFDLAADDSVYPDLNLGSWQTNALYLPAWGGGGGSYDDEVPPPNATHQVDTGEFDAVYGGTYAQIGEWSRASHATQGMGRLLDEENWPVQLHQLKTASNTPFADKLTENLPTTLAEMAEFCSGEPGKKAALKASELAAEALAAFPDIASVIPALCELQTCLDVMEGEVTQPHRHRIQLKKTQSAMAMSEACQMQISFGVTPEIPVIGAATTARISWHQAEKAGLEINNASWQDPLGAIDASGFVAGTEDGKRRSLSSEFSFTGDTPTPVMTGWHGVSVRPSTLHAQVEFTVRGTKFRRTLMPDQPLGSTPPLTAAINPAKQLVILNKPENLSLQLAVMQDAAAGVSLTTDEITLNAAPNSADALIVNTANTLQKGASFTFDVALADNLRQGRYSLAAQAGGVPLLSSQTLAYPHIRTQTLFQPCKTDIVAVDTASLHGIRVGWIDGGVDRAWFWTEQLGASVTQLDNDALLSGNLDGFDVIVSGVFAGGTRPINQAMDRLKGWMQAGGRYVSQYHRPQDNWISGQSAPYDLMPGSPSIRWRVTEADAPVKILVPDHELMAGPNQITLADFDGWEKERGLYFASEWGDEYTPILAMSDAGEDPLYGSLAHAPVGNGSHVHCALNLFYQMDQLVPGAFRIFTNLLQVARH